VTKLLITGAGGMLGANLVLDALAAGHEVVAVDFLHPVLHPEIESVTADLTRPGSAMAVFAAHQPEWAIHCAAATDVDACEADPETAFRLNRDMAGQVAMAAQAVGVRLVHISTDAVFDGQRGGYTEEDLPHPINVYGESKLEGERAVLGEYPGALIVRTNIYGWNAQAKQSLAEWFLARLEAGQETVGFTDAWFTPILVNDLNDRLLRMLERGLHGVFHVAGRECISKYEFGKRLAEMRGVDATLLHPVSRGASGLRARRGSNLCLDCQKAAAALAGPLPGVVQGLSHFLQLARDGHATALKSMIPIPETGPSGGGVS
jgi:dTDP-4-dehydrorhamnose reductase